MVIPSELMQEILVIFNEVVHKKDLPFHIIEWENDVFCAIIYDDNGKRKRLPIPEPIYQNNDKQKIKDFIADVLD